MTSLHKNQLIQLTITSLSSDGNGVGRYEGKAVFVPGTAPGDTLTVRVVKDAKQYTYGRVEQVVTPGPGRITPDCPIALRCGGCTFRHLTYEAELAAKHTFVQDALRRIGGLDITAQPVMPSPAVNRYRNKAQYPVAPGSDDSGILYGFYADRSHRIIPCADCLLQPETVNRIAARTAQLLREIGVSAYDETAHSGLVRHIYIRQGWHSGEVMLCLVTTTHHFPQKELLADTLRADFPEITTILLNINPDKTNVILGQKNVLLYGSGVIHDTLCGVPLQLGPLSFSQVNTPGAEQLFAIAKQFAAPSPDDTLLDLYCGAGVIGLSMAREVKQLIGVEIVAEAIENAKAAANEMGLSNTRFLCADAGTAAAQLAQEGARPSIITVDPPRKGCDEATIAAMLAMQPQRIVMVSCNPATLARDLARLVQGGYTVQAVQPVDMFARTKHVECVVLMSKGEGDKQ